MDKKNLLGIILSILCIIHCTIPFFTVLASLSPFTTLIENSKIIHIFLFALVLIVYLIVFPKNYLVDQYTKILIIATIGLILLFISLFLSGNLEILTTLIGAIILLLAHYRNYQMHRN